VCMTCCLILRHSPGLPLDTSSSLSCPMVSHCYACCMCPHICVPPRTAIYVSSWAAARYLQLSVVPYGLALLYIAIYSVLIHYICVLMYVFPVLLYVCPHTCRSLPPALCRALWSRTAHICMRTHMCVLIYA
jgi:hypothetical protein